ncbi:hypothetical protein M8818_004578 [Zalaria obscura]|uniref:Uncharacterized protein n=1 Tax=Zalaria obscura TaxID=2024903 RepID=A0ACC3SCE8_9PEZI
MAVSRQVKRCVVLEEGGTRLGGGDVAVMGTRAVAVSRVQVAPDRAFQIGLGSINVPQAATHRTRPASNVTPVQHHLPLSHISMSADFWAGYLSGAVGILIGNPLDLIKTRLQAGSLYAPDHASVSATSPSQFDRVGSLVKGSAAPILGYGALNALMFMTYNRTMFLLYQDPAHPSSLSRTWVAGAVAGLATFVVSAPTELIKCRTQVSGGQQSSWTIAKDIWRQGGIRGLYWGGAVTSIRDSVGYGF